MSTTYGMATVIEKQLLDRNEILEAFFHREAPRLAHACSKMANHFLHGGRLLAFGRGPYATDAQHVSVEFVHPVIVGKRALPALDLSLHFRPWMDAIIGADDIAMGFGPPEGDPDVQAALGVAEDRGALTFALPGSRGAYAAPPATTNPFIHQELTEILYHTLWETVHVFLEHQEMGHDVGEAGFLYPFLGGGRETGVNLIDEVAGSIVAKVADDADLRAQVAREEQHGISEAAVAIHERVARGGKLILFGNGGSATDANDLAIDCVSPPPGYHPIPAISLSSEAANITAIANDVGADVIFLRQLIAHARPGDVAVAISTSGGSRNIIAALEEARKRGLLTLALLGYDGGEIRRRDLSEICIVVHSDYIPRIQEIQASIYHVIRESLEMLARAEA